MTTLSRVTALTKKILLGFGIGAGGLILILIIVQFIQSLIPKKVPPPTVTFGTLPAIQFPQSVPSQNFTYTINTLSGQFPLLPDRVAVYKTSHPEISLLSLTQAKNIMAQNNFINNPVKITDTLYSWQQDASPNAKITYDIVTNNFSFNLNLDYLNNPNVIAAQNMPDQQGAINNARNFFGNLSADFSDIDPGKAKATILAIVNGKLIPSTSVSTNQVARVDFYQNDIDKIPVYYPHYPDSTIYAIVAAVNFPNLIAEAKYYRQPIIYDPTQAGTYPIKTADEAFKELTGNKAYIARYDGTRTDILLQDAYLAYYVSDTEQNYILPVIVFKGNDNFYAYVSAIKDDWIK